MNEQSHRSHLPELAVLPESEWRSLVPADRVAVQRQGEALERGTVDQVAASATAFWVWLDHGKGRILVYPGDSAVVWREESSG